MKACLKCGKSTIQTWGGLCLACRNRGYRVPAAPSAVRESKRSSVGANRAGICPPTTSSGSSGGEGLCHSRSHNTCTSEERTVRGDLRQDGLGTRSGSAPQPPARTRMKPLLTVHEVAALLKVSPYTIYSWVSQRRISHCHVGRQLRFVEEDVQAIIQHVDKFEI